MSAIELEPLADRLVRDPHDAEALATAYEVGTHDPQKYAEFLERVAERSTDGAIASHWYGEAATVWSASLEDAPSAARALMKAVDRDPYQDAPAERLAEMYREKSDTKGLIALLERRANALGALAQNDPEVRAKAAALHRELGHLWGEAPLSQSGKAIENFRAAAELEDPSVSTLATLRQLLRQEQRASEALPYYAREQGLLEDPEQKVALYLEEAEVHRELGDLLGVTSTLRAAHELSGQSDPGLKQQLGAVILERVHAGEAVPDPDRDEAAGLFLELAEEFPGEHGYSYSACALELRPANERAVQLVMFYGAELGQDEDAAPRAAEYLRANPDGVMAEEAVQFVARVLGADVASACLEAGRQAAGTVTTAEPSREAPQSSREAPQTAVQVNELSVVVRLLEEGQTLARKARKHEAATRYQTALQHDPGNLEAIAFLQSYFRQTRKYKDLREMLVNASRVGHVDARARLEWLREVAALSETQLKDLETAIWAWQQITILAPGDEQGTSQLMVLMERGGRWDDLSTLIEQRAEITTDLEERLVLEKKAAKIHEERRQDLVASGSVWARVASLTPDDESAIWTALDHFRRASRLDLATQAITEVVPQITSEPDRARLLVELGKLSEGLGEPLAAADAFTEAATLVKDPSHLEQAERLYAIAGAYNQAATSVESRLGLENEPSKKALLLARAAGYLEKAGDHSESVARLEQAVDLDPAAKEPALELEASYRREGRLEDVVTVLLERAEKIKDKALRVELRKQAAQVQRYELSDVEGARDALGLVLEDVEDVEVLERLAQDEMEQGNWAEAAQYLHREALAEGDAGKKVSLMLREAAIHATQLADRMGAIERYEAVLKSFDAKHPEALQKLADLYRAEENPAEVARCLERLLEITEDSEAQLEIANRLADIYEEELDSPKDALRCLLLVKKLDEEDFAAIQRLSALSERLGDWESVAAYMVLLIEVEGDEEEISQMTRRRASILSEHLARHDEALLLLESLGDQGDEPCRDAFVKLGDDLGKKIEVATALVRWYRPLKATDKGRAALTSAFERLDALGKGEDLLAVGFDVLTGGGGTSSLARRVEEVACERSDFEALGLAQQFLVGEHKGRQRAEELVRQAGVLKKAGVSVSECLAHGELGFPLVGPGEARELLERLSNLAESDDQVVDLYEHQVMRCKEPGDRLHALVVAAEVAARRGVIARARQFFELSLAGAVDDGAIELLAQAARDADQGSENRVVVRLLAQVLSESGGAARDGGRSRSRFLARAARLALDDLKDEKQAFSWVADALIAHVDEERIADVVEFARRTGDMSRVDATFDRAFEEVFDGPLVRLLLSKRAALRRGELNDPKGAASDLKRLHDLAPGDQAVSDQLLELYRETGDYLGTVKLYEDLILRCKDKEQKIELSRKVAGVYEEKLSDFREAADAWRRVLRLKPGDIDATSGLERAKHNMLHSRPPAANEEQGEQVSTGGGTVDAGAGEPQGVVAEGDNERRARSAGVMAPLSFEEQTAVDALKADLADGEAQGRAAESDEPSEADDTAALEVSGVQGKLGEPQAADAGDDDVAEVGVDDEVSSLVYAEVGDDDEVSSLVDAEVGDDDEVSSLVDTHLEEPSASFGEPLGLDLSPTHDAAPDVAGSTGFFSSGPQPGDLEYVEAVSNHDLVAAAKSGELTVEVSQAGPPEFGITNGELDHDEEVDDSEVVSSAPMPAAASTEGEPDASAKKPQGAEPFEDDLDGDAMAEELSAVFKRIEEPAAQPAFRAPSSEEIEVELEADEDDDATAAALAPSAPQQSAAPRSAPPRTAPPGPPPRRVSPPPRPANGDRSMPPSPPRRSPPPPPRPVQASEGGSKDPRNEAKSDD